MKTIIITGTRKGIGLALAQYYLDLGWRVVGCSRRKIDFEHEAYTHYELDVSDEKAVVAMAREIKRMHGGIDALINNAGMAAMNAFLLTPGKTVERIFNTNVFGCFYLMREVAKLMMQSKKVGRIINFSTVAVAFDLEGEAAYAASKAAIESLTRTAARELADYGITVNAIGPTPVATDLIKGVPLDKIQSLVERQAIKRKADMDDIINITDFFLSERSSFVTGQILYLGGVHG